MRQQFEAGKLDAFTVGAPPGAKERLRKWLEEQARQLDEETPAT